MSYIFLHDPKGNFELIEGMLSKRMVLVSRLGKQETLSPADQAKYYSAWHFAAVHIALTVPSLRSPRSLSENFRIPIKRINEVLEFLEETGLARRNKPDEFQVGSSRIRIDRDSPNILHHYANWRQQAIESLDREELEDMHYSGVVSLNKKDAAKLKDFLLTRLKDDLDLIHSSHEEEVYCYNIDFFRLRR